MVSCNVLITKGSEPLAMLHCCIGDYGLPEKAGSIILPAVCGSGHSVSPESFLAFLLGLMDPNAHVPYFKLVPVNDQRMCDFVYSIDFPDTDGLEIHGRAPVVFVQGFGDRFAHIFAAGIPDDVMFELYNDGASAQQASSAQRSVRRDLDLTSSMSSDPQEDYELDL